MFTPRVSQHNLSGCVYANLKLAFAVWTALALLFAAVWNQAYAAAPQEYTLGAGDKLKVIVFGHPNMSGEFSIAGDGTVSLPFVGSVRAGGLTIRQLELEIVDRLKPDYLKNPRVSVGVLNFRPFDIIGEVQKPGSYPYRNGMTVINAVAMAGGFTYRARENEFRIKRAGTGGFVKAAPDTVVMPGDVIKVLERWF
jgi:protein involved in polysaccharide export with SLBB domain